MRFLFQPKKIRLSDALRESLQLRIRFALSRFSERIREVAVTLDDVNGPRGGIDKRCQVELRTQGAGPVVVASVAGDWRTALDNALARAARFLMRLWRRGSDSRRMRQRFIGHEG